MRGRSVRTLVNGYMAGGAHRVRWDGKDNTGRELSSGTYIFQLKAGQFYRADKAVLTR